MVGAAASSALHRPRPKRSAPSRAEPAAAGSTRLAHSAGRGADAGAAALGPVAEAGAEEAARAIGVLRAAVAFLAVPAAEPRHDQKHEQQQGGASAHRHAPILEFAAPIGT